MAQKGQSHVAEGDAFRDLCRKVLERDLGVRLEIEYPILLGQPAKQHRFDLVSLPDREWFVECRSLSWRRDGGVPNGKLSGLSEPLGWLRLLPPGPRKVLCLRRAQHQHGCETLADYYVRLHRVHLAEVGLAEIDSIRETIRWLIPATRTTGAGG